MSGFQATYDEDGNLRIENGVVFGMKTRNIVRVGAPDGGVFGTTGMGASPSGTPAGGLSGSSFVGGSGRNLIATTVPDPLGAVGFPAGWFVPTSTDVFVSLDNPEVYLSVYGETYADIADATDVIAELDATVTAPIGSYVATAYGEAAYNDGDPFTVELVAEYAPGGTPNNLDVHIRSGTAQGGMFQADSAEAYHSTVDADWTLAIDGYGVATLYHDTDAVAVRAAGSHYDATGAYESTTLGADDYNGGVAWTAVVVKIPKPTRPGYAYIRITEAAGSLDTAAGPFFSTDLPANAGDDYYFPVCQADGSAVEQLHTGMIQWP